jgi:hypothetical protein
MQQNEMIGKFKNTSILNTWQGQFESKKERLFLKNLASKIRRSLAKSLFCPDFEKDPFSFSFLSLTHSLSFAPRKSHQTIRQRMR